MNYPNKMLSREAALERYGAIDWATKTWPDAHKWLTTFEIPRGKFPNLTIMETGIQARHIACNKDILSPLSQAFHQLIYHQLDQYLLTYDGCQNIRMVRGTVNEPSTHCWGLAVDFNAATNELGTVGDMREDVAMCFTEVGFNWGRLFSRVDSMHYSYAWEGIGK